MSLTGAPPADIDVSGPLVRSLLREQHPDLADRALEKVAEGWDNVLFRLGADLAVRLPRRSAAAALLEQEQRRLPQLRDRLPLPIPSPIRTGRPGCGFPWCWSVVPWFPGQTALTTRFGDLDETASHLGRFVRRLHEPAADDALHNPFRGVQLATRDPLVRKHVQQLGNEVDGDAVLDFWQRALEMPAWTGPPLWIHGDLHPGNLIVEDGRLSAVVDFGDMTAGDPATDLAVGWMLFPPRARSRFREAAAGKFDPIDEHTWARARAWALALSLAYLASARDDPEMASYARTALGRVLSGAD
jgi:aminoglycoside phosphotransferase (APT) family kinase protein